MKDHLIFDASSILNINDTDNVGAFVRSSKAGALITNHSAFKAAPTGFSFVDADVTVGSDSIAETAHGLLTGDKVQLTTSGVLPAGLALTTDYYVIRVDANNFKLASSAYNAEWDIAVDITAAAGGGTHNVVGYSQDARALDVYVVNPVDVTGTVTANQGTSPWVVSATDLDIRDLSHTQDSIKIGDGTDFLAINADGSINVNADISVTNGHEKAEDSAHSSGDIGSFMLAVRQDTLAASVDADGDYAALKVDDLGALYVNVASFDATVTVTATDLDIRDLVYTQDSVTAYQGTSPWVVNDAALADTAILSAANPLNVADTAEAVKASALANRKYLWIYNNDNTRVFIGASGVTAANGFPVSPGSYLELRAGPSVSPYFVGQSGKTPEIRTLELS